MIDLSKYDPWHDPIYIKWEQEQRVEQLKRADYYEKNDSDGWCTDMANMIRAQNAQPRNPANYYEALWQPLKAEALLNSEAIAFTVKTGGAVTITPQSVTIDGAANKDQATIETAVLHAKTQWGGKMQIDSGTEEFKARAWAAAQLHGVKVHGYKPTKEARELAKTITSYRQSQPVQQHQPERPKAKPVFQHTRAPAFA